MAKSKTRRAIMISACGVPANGLKSYCYLILSVMFNLNAFQTLAMDLRRAPGPTGSEPYGDPTPPIA